MTEHPDKREHATEDDEAQRVSLHPLDPATVLRRMLATPPVTPRKRQD